jgi:Reverse transcriptase (RNA-dependent DNA polymerase)
MYYHEILCEPDKDQFIEAMVKEIQQHNERDNWRVVGRSQVPLDHKILPSVWAMRRTRDLTTGEVVKWKARLNVDGSKQQKGIDFDETFSPVASWATIRLILVLAVINKWFVHQLDFVQAFPQAPVEQDLYIEIPKGCHVEGDADHYALQVLRNIYGQRQAGKVWFDYLTDGLISKLGFKQSDVDPCVLWRGTCLMEIYTDDTLITGPDQNEIRKVISEISPLYEITSKEHVSDFLGVNINTSTEGHINLTQQKLIQSILTNLQLDGKVNTRTTLAPSTIFTTVV